MSLTASVVEFDVIRHTFLANTVPISSSISQQASNLPAKSQTPRTPLKASYLG